MASALLSVFNFSLLIISASPVIAKFLGIRAIYPALLMPPIAVVCVLALGWWLDTKGKMLQRMERENIARSPVWAKLFEQLDRIEKK